MKKVFGMAWGLLLTGLATFLVIRYVGPWLVSFVSGLFNKSAPGDGLSDTK